LLAPEVFLNLAENITFAHAPSQSFSSGVRFVAVSCAAPRDRLAKPAGRPRLFICSPPNLNWLEFETF
jgi:hypothetical protein